MSHGFPRDQNPKGASGLPHPLGPLNSTKFHAKTIALANGTLTTSHPQD